MIHQGIIDIGKNKVAVRENEIEDLIRNSVEWRTGRKIETIRLAADDLGRVHAEITLRPTATETLEYIATGPAPDVRYG